MTILISYFTALVIALVASSELEVSAGSTHRSKSVGSDHQKHSTKILTVVRGIPHPADRKIISVNQ
jgi:hypothetical protein